MDQETFQNWANKISIVKTSKDEKDPQMDALIGEFADSLRTSTVFAGFIPDPEILEGVLDWIMQPVFLCGTGETNAGELLQSFVHHPAFLVLPGNFYFFKKHKLWLDVCFIDIARQAMSYLINPPGTEIGWCLGQDIRAYEGYLKYLHFFLHYSKQDALVCMVMALYAAAPERTPALKCWVESSPDNEQHVYSLQNSFAGAKFIHLTRDSSPNSLYTAQTNREQLGAERYHLLRTEDLTENAEDALLKIGNFLNIQFDSKNSMKQY
jgi:hypothetical protein